LASTGHDVLIIGAGGRLIKDGIITLSGTDFSRDIMDQAGSYLMILAILTSIMNLSAAVHVSAMLLA
jgi:hypothetical protein